ncbi:testis-expressed protein 13D-like [Mus musculus]|jgi:hypothetical protein|uniref:TEX13 family member D n=1 Tax=Mus musculus TaxID=10090 RepID=A0A0G2JGA3_MOUSE|nr:testis-expressed protein 13D-like [Mus musculus]|eukprot:XP_006541630.1 PREDICTED: testis-expressed sequence 13C protein-like [Mus musculus]
MAMDWGDHSTGFRHSEVIRFINNEILMNGGGPEFYLAFRMRPWNEIEDQLRAILIDPQVPRSLKRACTWSALALGVRIAARQREQQAYMVGLSQDAFGQLPSAPRASVSELWQLRQQREEAVTQLISTQAALQQAMRECDLLRRRLHHVERSVQMAPLVHDIQSQQLGASVVPLSPDHARVMGTVGAYDRRYLEAQMSAATNVFYMPGSTSSWPLAMQPTVPVPVPYQLPAHPPFLTGSPFLMPFSPSVVVETEAGVVAPVPLPPAYPSGPFAAPCSQNPASVWDQRSYTYTTEGPLVTQRAVPAGNIRDTSQEGNSGKCQGTNTLGDNRSHLQEQDRQGVQYRATLVDTENDNEGENEELEATSAVAAEAASEESTDTAEDEQEEEEEVAEKEEAYDNAVDLQNLQELHLPGQGQLHSQSDNRPQASGPASLYSGRCQIKEEDVEEAPPIPVWESWSQAVRESPKKQQPQLPKKDKKPQAEAASESQPSSHSRMNWVCPRCKSMNFSWRKVCYKCKKICMPAEFGGQPH